MTLRGLQLQALVLVRHREHVERMERRLMIATREYLVAYKGGTRAIARKMGFSPAYISDVLHGRRKVSETFLERLDRLS